MRVLPDEESGEQSERRDASLRGDAERLALWLSIEPSRLRDVPREALEAILGVIDGFRLAAEQSHDQRETIVELLDRVVMLERLARRDHSTGLANRRAVEERLDEEWERARRYKHDLAVIAIDVDGLKRTNDEFGHHAGDQLLLEIALRIGKNVRMGDFAGRIGGDEFVVICPQTDSLGARRVAEKLVTAVSSEPVSLAGIDRTASISVGCATASESLSAKAMVQSADAALYDAKELARLQRHPPADPDPATR